MAQGKPIGNVVGFITIIAIIVGVGTFFLLFAACYKLTNDGMEDWDLSQCFKRKNERYGEGRQPESSAALPPASSAPQSAAPADQQGTTRNGQSSTMASISHPREASETKETDLTPPAAQVSEVAAIVIPVHVKVPKQGREIVTPRAVPLGPVKIAVEATPYESDIESQTTVIEVTNNHRNRATMASQGSAAGSAAALDSRAPNWYNELNEVDEDLEAAVQPATRRGSANTTGAAATRTSQTAVVLDHRAPTWYDD